MSTKYKKKIQLTKVLQRNFFTSIPPGGYGVWALIFIHTLVVYTVIVINFMTLVCIWYKIIIILIFTIVLWMIKLRRRSMYILNWCSITFILFYFSALIYIRHIKKQSQPPHFSVCHGKQKTSAQIFKRFLLINRVILEKGLRK